MTVTGLGVGWLSVAGVVVAVLVFFSACGRAD